MKNRSKLLVFAAVILAALYAYRFTDWFAEKKIQIKYRLIPDPNAPGAIDPILFYLEREYPLTSIKVISVTEAATNKYPHAFWHLVAVSNAAPLTDFSYGATVPGMKSKIAGLAAEPLLPNMSYRIYIETAKMNGEKEFQPRRKNAR